MTWKNKNVLITGATHFIASHLAEQLVRLGCNVKAFIRYDYQKNQGSLDKLPVHIENQISVISGNLTNPEAIDRAASDADLIFHFGMLDMIPYSHVNFRDWLEANILGTLNVLNAAKKHEVQKLVHVSTIEVYGEVKDMPVDEEHPLQAQSPYIASIIGAEKLAEGYYSSENLPVVIIRLSNVYGPVQSRASIIPTIIAQGLVEQKLFLGNMHAIRDFVYVDDVVDGFLKTAETPKSIGKAINLGTGEGISIGDLADKVMSSIGRDVEILFDATKIRPSSHDIEQLVADIKKANQLLYWQPKTSLDNGLKQTIEWFSEHTDIDRKGRS